MKQLNKLITGMAGEYLVAGQMSLLGWTANLTYKNYPGVDIIGQHPVLGDNKVALIQVKSSIEPSFWVGIKYSQLERLEELIKGPYVLVYFEKKDGRIAPSYYILTKHQIMDIINQSDEAYRVNRANRALIRNKPLASDYSIKIYIKRDGLSQYKDKWERLFEIE